MATRASEPTLRSSFAQRVRRLAPRALLCLVGLSAALGAQDPGRDLPPTRDANVAAADRVAVGIARLRAGWSWEAARLFREEVLAKSDAPLPHLLLGLSMRSVPNRAARHVWDAVQRRGAGAPEEQALVDAYRLYYGVDRQPELVDERFAAAPPNERLPALVRALEAAAARGGAGQPVAAALCAWEQERLAAPQPLTPAVARSWLRQQDAYLAAVGGAPFLVPGYAGLLARAVEDPSLRAAALQRLPRHPEHPPGALPRAPLPGFEAGSASSWRPGWTPRVATGFELPSGVAGNVRFVPTSGKPTLVVFFLGFGCAHCVAQLKDLDPKAPKFRAAGIEVLSIGTDDLTAVRAAQQAAQENGVDPLHFDVLCDPEGVVFRQWGVWDAFGGEALHGTFLVDGDGRVLWQDVSDRPFEQSDWLLAECRRLLAAWR